MIVKLIENINSNVGGSEVDKENMREEIIDNNNNISINMQKHLSN